MKKLLLAGIMALLPACMYAQTMDTTVVKVPYDSTWQVPFDSVFKTQHDTTVVVMHDTTVTVSHDTTATFLKDSMVISPKPPVIPPVAGTHEPAGFKPLIVHPLTTIRTNGNGPVGFQSWGGSGLGTVVDPTKKVSVLNCRHNVGQRGGSPSCTIWANEAQLKAANVTQIYTRVQMWVDPTFVLHPSNVEKLLVIGTGKSPNQYIGAMSTGFRMRNSIQGVNPPLPTIPPGQSWGGPSCSVSLGCSWAPPPGGLGVRGSGWHTIEWLLVNAPAPSKGSAMTVWVDGNLSATYSGFDFLYPSVQGNDPRWTKWTISTYWGGTGSTYPSPASDIRFSDLYVSGK